MVRVSLCDIFIFHYSLLSSVAGPTERQVVEELKAAELKEAREGRAPLVEGKMTQSAFLKAGLQLEDSQ